MLTLIVKVMQVKEYVVVVYSVYQWAGRAGGGCVGGSV